MEHGAHYALEMMAKVRAKRTSNETLWSAFRRRIRRAYIDGSMRVRLAARLPAAAYRDRPIRSTTSRPSASASRCRLSIVMFVSHLSTVPM